MIPLLGFAPDVDPTTPGVIVDCTNFIPYATGMESAPSAVSATGVPVLAAECLGAAVVTNLDGTRRVLAGTATKLYEIPATTWIDIGRVAAYAGGADTRWTFAQFGNTTIATNRADAMQRSTAAGVAFADIAGAPKAEIAFSIGSQVMALNVNDGAEKPDGWAVCAANDETSWAASLATLAANGRLVSTPGKLTAGARLGDFAVAYKERSLYLGRFVGPPSIWDWVLVAAGDVGCVGKEALCDLDGTHFFVGEGGFFLFDGGRPVPIGEAVIRQWFYDNSSQSFRYKTKCVYDRQTRRVWIFYPSKNASSCDSALVYHIDAKKWGRATYSIEAALNYISAGYTINSLDSAGATHNALPQIPFDSQYWMAGGRALSVFNLSHQLQLLTGISGASGFTTGDMGDDNQYSLLTEVRLRFESNYQPTTASCQAFGKANSSDSLSLGPLSQMANGKFDLLQEARWHRAAFSFTGSTRVTAAGAKSSPAGDQ